MIPDTLGLPQDIAYDGIDHLGVAVRDLEAAMHTYGKVLGFTISGQEELPDRGIKVAFVQTPNSRIELIAPMRDNSEVSKFLEKRGEGIHHICVRVKDISSCLKALVARGAQLIDTAPKQGAHGCQVAFVHPKGTHGVLLELSQHPEKSH